jgi:hypothetical protein
MGDATGRPDWRSSVLGVPGAEFFCGKLGVGTRQEKRSKKNETKALEKLTPLMGIRSQSGFPTAAFREAAVHLKHAFFWSEGWGAAHDSASA